jgi:F-type H+-transporting ATPase subunit alpha
MDDIAIGDVRRFEDELREFFRSRHPGILSEIRDTGKMPEGGEVENAIADFKAAFEGTGVEE